MTQLMTKPYIGKKVIATLIDYTFIFAFSLFYIMTFGEPNAEGGKTIDGLPALIPELVWFLYFVVIEKYYAATLGHEIVGLKVVSIDGNKLDLIQVLKRRISDALEIFPCFGLIAYILVKNTEKNQRLGDIWAKTLVVTKNEVEKMPLFEFETNTSAIKNGH